MAWRPFLGFRRSGTRVIVAIDAMLHGVPSRYELPVECGGEVCAELLSDHLAIMRDEVVRKVVEQAYASGYRDGRAKRGRAKHHDTILGRDVP